MTDSSLRSLATWREQQHGTQPVIVIAVAGEIGSLGTQAAAGIAEKSGLERLGKLTIVVRAIRSASPVHRELPANLDFTAHGEVVNGAARLEAANEELGSSICIGPVAALQPTCSSPARHDPTRGRAEAIAVFEPGNSTRHPPRWSS